MEFKNTHTLQILQKYPFFIVNVKNHSQEMVSLLDRSANTGHRYKYYALWEIIRRQTDIQKYGGNIRDHLIFKKHLHKSIQKKIFHKNWLDCQFIHKISPSVQLYMLKENINCFVVIRNLCTEAISYVNEFIRTQNEINKFDKLSSSDRLEKIKKNGTFIFYIKNPSLEEQEAAIKSDPINIGLILHPDPSIQLKVLRTKGLDWLRVIKNPCEEAKFMFINEHPDHLGFIKNPSYEIQYNAVKNCPPMIKFSSQKSKELRMVALTEYPPTIALLNKPTFEEEMYAWGRGLPLPHFKNPSYKFVMEVLCVYPRFIKYLSNPTDEMIEKAIEADPMNVLFIGNSKIDIMADEYHGSDSESDN